MALPEIEIESEEDYWNRNKKRKNIVKIVTCNSCDQNIERNDGRVMSHNRRVFRDMKNGHPNWVIEACPGGNI